VWKSIDSWDDSRQNLTITPVGRASDGYKVVLFDHGASACGLNPEGQPMYPGIGIGTGSANENVLQMQFAFWCLGRSRWLFGQLTPTFTYEAGTDTLFDSWGTRWYRQSGE
jgi:hypothetical protein